MATTTRRRKATAAGAPPAPPAQPLTAADLVAFMGDVDAPDTDDSQAALDWARAMVTSHLGAPIPDLLPHNLRQALLLTAARWLLTGGENPDEPIPLQARYLLKLHAADRP
jgi:hypothetical protein